MDGHAADQLDVKMDHVPDQLMVADDDLPAHKPSGGVLHRGECLGQDLIKRFPRLQAGPEFICLCAQLVIGEGLVALFQFVDADDRGSGFLQELLIVPAGKAFEQK